MSNSGVFETALVAVRGGDTVLAGLVYGGLTADDRTKLTLARAIVAQGDGLLALIDAMVEENAEPRLEVTRAIEVETSRGHAVLTLARRAGERERVTAMYDRTGQGIVLAPEQASRIWFERTSPLGMGLPIDPVCVEPGDYVHVVTPFALTWKDIRTTTVTEVVLADGSWLLGVDDLEVIDVVETVGETIAA